MALRAWKVSGAFEKRVPGEFVSFSTQVSLSLGIVDIYHKIKKLNLKTLSNQEN